MRRATLRLAALAAALVAVAPAAHASMFLVGPGHFSTIQAGINAALAAGGNNEVRVRTGNYTENITFSLPSGSLDISGGWNSAFSTRDPDPTATLVAGGNTNRVFLPFVSGAANLTISDFSIAGGATVDCGGGMYVVTTNNALAQIRNSHFLLNSAQVGGNGIPRGGGFCAIMEDASALIFDGNQVLANTAQTATGLAYGAGIYVEAFNATNVVVNNNLFNGNVATATDVAGRVYGAGAAFVLDGSAQLSFSNNVVTSNQAQAQSLGQGHSSGAYVDANCAVGCAITLHADVFDKNLGGFDGQLEVFQDSNSGNSSLHLDNLLVTRGQYGGVYLYVHSGSVNLTNLSVADNANVGLNCFDFVPFTMFNTIAYNNGSDGGVGSGSSQGNNLIGIDPHFIDAAHGNYRLRADSAARDAGTATPPGGLGLFDLDGNPRNFGAAPDIGAYEIGDKIFKNGFET